MKPLPCLFILLAILASCQRSQDKNCISLAGEWSFQSDSSDKGMTEQWYAVSLHDKVHLPGSMAENGKGEDIGLHTRWTGQIVDSSWYTSPRYRKYRQPGNIKIPFWLQPEKHYIGVAWYQKQVDIPVSWKGKNIQLFLERCHWETRVWVDDHEAGMRNFLGTPHVYDLSSLLVPGRHKLTIRVDNRIKDIDVGQNSHSISDHTQTNWNGMVGRLELIARAPLYISTVELYPDLYHKQVLARFLLINTTGAAVQAKVTLNSRVIQGKDKDVPESVSREITVSQDTQKIDMIYPMGAHPQTWDEFHPDLYCMRVTVTSSRDEMDIKEIPFGFRDLSTQGTQLMINGRPLFLRGTLECAIFPLTGYPPTDTAAWIRIFRIARAHGLNHFRFHSWCPPEAAFEAADRTGFYLHVECSSWANQGTTIGDGKLVDRFIYDESERMIEAYGNHPSFCFMLYGNEPAGNNQQKWLGDLIRHWKSRDNRRLYSSGAGWPVIPETDFNSTAIPRIQGWEEGLRSIMNAQPPSTDYDWRQRIAGFNKPTVSHEIGQWCVYPDFKEIKRYTGIVKAKNFEIFRDFLEQNGMGSLADSFLIASGKLQALCYKADIEAALRTPHFGGFQLLDLHDFPGQGTALVGVLNAFWDEKGYITPGEYRRFCNATVPLVRLHKMIFTSAETLHASVEIAHFGEKELNGVVPVWKLTGSHSQILARGVLPRQNIPIGNNIKLGEISQPLAFITQPCKLTLSVRVAGFENSWDIWVYPSSLPHISKPVLVTQVLDARAIDELNRGGNVLLTVKKGSVRPDKGGTVALGFSSIFWNTAWTSGQAPHTMGILCNPSHPALADFPTDFYSNWEWWDAMSHGNAIMLSDFPGIIPIVRIIDDWFTARPLALIFEARVGKGKIMVCGSDLITGSETRPEARQLRYSLEKYMTSDSFTPSVSVEMNKLKALFN